MDRQSQGSIGAGGTLSGHEACRVSTGPKPVRQVASLLTKRPEPESGKRRSRGPGARFLTCLPITPRFDEIVPDKRFQRIDSGSIASGRGIECWNVLKIAMKAVRALSKGGAVPGQGPLPFFSTVSKGTKREYRMPISHVSYVAVSAILSEGRQDSLFLSGCSP